jgi:hypothetical protein
MYFAALVLNATKIVFSSQSSALFMPAGVQVNTDEAVVSNEVGC